MKNVLHFSQVVLLLCLSLNVCFAQTYQLQLDSVTMNYNGRETSYCFKYNDQGLVTEKTYKGEDFEPHITRYTYTYFKKIDSIIEPDMKTKHTYDGSKNLIYKEEFGLRNGAYKSFRRRSYQYRDSLLVMEKENVGYEGGSVGQSDSILYSHDSKGNVVEIIKHIWGEFDTTWVMANRSLYEYNVHDLEVKHTLSSYDISKLKWVDIERQYSTYSDTLLTKFEVYQENQSFNTFERFYLDSYEYDFKGNIQSKSGFVFEETYSSQFFNDLSIKAKNILIPTKDVFYSIGISDHLYQSDRVNKLDSIIKLSSGGFTDTRYSRNFHYSSSTIGVEEIPITHWNIHPNPSNGEFVINGDMAITSCLVYNQSGRLIKRIIPSNSERSIEFQLETTGVYLIHVQKANSSQVLKAVVMR